VANDIFNLTAKDYSLRKRIFDDLVGKADVLQNDSRSWRHLTMEEEARAAYCSYQVFLCYYTSLAGDCDLDKGLKYLYLSASYGFIVACLMIGELEDKSPSSIQDLPKSVIPGLEAFTALGPRYGMSGWLKATRILQRLSPSSAERSRALLHTTGYSELGENPNLNKAQARESFRGPDVRYQWLARGTMSLFLRVVFEWPAELIVQAFESGELPTDGRNYNNETALYMCCRVGAAKTVLSLLSVFEWARRQTTTATDNGFQPLHWLHTFHGEDVKAVGDALMQHGADIDAQVSVAGHEYRPLDFAVAAGNQDAMDYLMSRRQLPTILV
jgi:hypothetical protein